MSEYFNDKKFYELEKFFTEDILPLNAELYNTDLRLGLLLGNIKIYKLKDVLLSKVVKIKGYSIEIFIDIWDEILQVSMNYIDLTRIIGILMDNAIEASS